MTPDQGKLLRQVFLDANKQESDTTKKVIRAIPDATKSYTPDPKSMTAHQLAWHITSAEIFFFDYILTGKFPTERPPEPPPTIAAILDWYETNHADRFNKVKEMSGEQLAAVLPFFAGTEYPAVTYLNFMNAHTIHHRGQLSTYLRPMGSKVPAIYGGSADEPMQT
jgi:uncharacterized damage-inducible protein DinB